MARAADSKKARDVVILEMRGVLGIADYFVICSGDNERQVRTIAGEIERSLVGRIKPYRREGQREGRWVLLDYIDVVVHVFRQEERDFYNIERLWKDAPMLTYEPEVATLAGGGG